MKIDEIKSLWWQPKRGEIGSIVEDIEDINQCIRIILATPKRSDPHRPELGSEIWKYVDFPVNEAIPHIIREAMEAIEKWEPRIEIKRITAMPEGSQIFLKIEWVLKETQEPYVSEVTL